MSEERKLIFIGDHFYNQSKTIMSPLYTEDGRRWDWGFVNVDLSEGKSVSIRQANAVERHYYEKRLEEIKSQQS